jgi:ABC-type branched-subunit amino acid transport system substrate-binding protein
MKRVNSLVVSCLALVMLFASLSSSFAVLTPSELGESNELFAAGRFNESLARLQPLVGEPILTAADAAGVLLQARILRQLGSAEAALSAIEIVPAGLRSVAHELLFGALLLDNGQAQRAAHVLQPLLQQSLSLAQRQLLYQNLADAAAEIGQPLLALYYLQQLLPLSVQQAPVLQQAHFLLQDQMSAADLSEASFVWHATEIGQDAMLQLARRALALQRYGEARDYASRILAAQTPFPYWYEATLLLNAAAPVTGVRRDRLGVMLPLSGRYAAYGDQLKKGMVLALTEYNRNALQKMMLTFEDTAAGEDPAATVERLVHEKQVLGVIGPLLKDIAQVAAQQAQVMGLPMLSLSQAQDIPTTGDYIFRDSLTPRHQVKALVEFAMQRGNTRFSILFPETPFGRVMNDNYITEVLAAGGQLIDFVSYTEDQTDFKQQTYDLLRMTDAMLEALESEDPEAEEYPKPPCDVVFIPDYADKLELLAPQLYFYGLKDTTLLGINGWNSAELAKKTGRYLKDAVFVDAYFASGDRPELRRFVELYRTAYQQEPNVLAAQAFDAAMLMLQASADPALVSRDDLRSRLSVIQDFQGVTGTTGFGENGESDKQLYFLGFKGGKIVEYVDPEPEFTPEAALLPEIIFQVQ